MGDHAVALQCLDRGRLCVDARRRLSDALGVPVPDPDHEGIVEVRVQAADFDEALQRAWDAMAAAGADDHLAFAEHPDIPHHWRRREPAEGPPGTAA